MLTKIEQIKLHLRSKCFSLRDALFHFKGIVRAFLVVSLFLTVGCAGRQSYTTQTWSQDQNEWINERKIIAWQFGTSGLHTKTKELEMKKTDAVSEVLDFGKDAVSGAIIALSGGKM